MEKLLKETDERLKIKETLETMFSKVLNVDIALERVFCTVEKDKISNSYKKLFIYMVNNNHILKDLLVIIIPEDKEIAFLNNNECIILPSMSSEEAVDCSEDFIRTVELYRLTNADINAVVKSFL